MNTLFQRFFFLRNNFKTASKKSPYSQRLVVGVLKSDMKGGGP
jgi:hypothetical protein